MRFFRRESVEDIERDIEQSHWETERHQASIERLDRIRKSIGASGEPSSYGYGAGPRRIPAKGVAWRGGRPDWEVFKILYIREDESGRRELEERYIRSMVHGGGGYDRKRATAKVKAQIRQIREEYGGGL